MVKEYYKELANGDYHSAYRNLSGREMERYGTFDLWQQAKTKESRAEVESIHLDYVTQDVDDDAVVDYIGYRVDFVDKRPSMLVRLYNTGNGWKIIGFEEFEED